MRAPRLVAPAILVASAPHTAVAQDAAHAELRHELGPGAEGCLSRAKLEDAVESQLGRDVFAADQQADFIVSSRVEQRPAGGFTATVVLERKDGSAIGTRELVSEAADCGELDASWVLVVALLVDQSSKEVVPAEPVPKASTRTKHAPPPPKPDPEAPSLRVPEDTPWHLDADLGGLLTAGPLPQWVGGARIGAGFQPPRGWRFELGVAAWLPVRTNTERGAEFWGILGDAYLCPLSLSSGPTGRSQVHACVGQQAGLVHATGAGFDRALQAARPWYEPGLRVRYAFLLQERWGFFAAAGLGFPVIRDRFYGTLDDGQETVVHRVGPVSGTGAVGVFLDYHP